jgi:hypothetical protein
MTTKRKTMKNIKQPVFYAEDFQSNDGMLTTIWGPPMWHYLHTMSFNYPVKPTNRDKKHYRDFVLNMVNVLPCGKCRKNLQRNFKKLPLTMSDMKSRFTFSMYIFKLHNLINKMLLKKSYLTYQQVRERYEHFRSRCANSATKKTQRKSTKEKGCTVPLTGEKSKCILKIVPRTEKCETFNVDKKCEKVRISLN